MIEIAIQSVLSKTVAPVKVFPLFGTIKPPFLTYTVTPLSGGYASEYQVEVKAITKSYAEGLGLLEKIKNVLDHKDQSNTIFEKGIYFRSQLAGGGPLFNDSIQTWELSHIYIITEV